MADFKEQVIAFAYGLFGKYIEDYISQKREFNKLRDDVKISNIGMTLTEFLCLIVMTGIVCFVVGTPFLSIFIYLVTQDVFFALFLSVFGALFSSFFISFSLLYIPSMMKGERNKRIEDVLPFALSYLSIMAGAQNPSVSMFKTISKFDEYGEISVEAKKIVEEVELMDVNFNDAIVHAAERTPSKTFKNILWGMKSTIDAGGNLKQYLERATAEAMESYKIRLTKYEGQVMLLTELYLTAVIVGSIFIIVLSVIFSVIGGMENDMIITMQLIIIILILPMSAGGFLLIERGIAPEQV